MDELSSITELLKDLIRENTKSAQSTFDLWFGDLKIISLTEDKAVLTTPTKLRKNILSTRYKDLLSGSLEAIIGFPVEIELVALDESPDMSKPAEEEKKAAPVEQKAAPAGKPKQPNVQKDKKPQKAVPAEPKAEKPESAEAPKKSNKSRRRPHYRHHKPKAKE